MQTKVADQSKAEQKAESNGASRPADERQELQSEEQAKEVASDIKEEAAAKGEQVKVYHIESCMGIYPSTLTLLLGCMQSLLRSLPAPLSLQKSGGMAAFLPTWLAK